jgi:DNA-binding IscR family transcriptional regulator
MLKDYEEEILLQLYDNGLIAMKYCSTQKAADIIKWQEIAKKYDTPKSFSSVLRKLAAKGYVDLHGKSGDVVSLSRLGVYYVKGNFPK